MRFSGWSRSRIKAKMQEIREEIKAAREDETLSREERSVLIEDLRADLQNLQDVLVRS